MRIDEYNDILKWISISNNIIEEADGSGDQQTQDVPKSQRIEALQIYDHIKLLVARDLEQIKNKETIDKILTTIAELVQDYNPDRDMDIDLGNDNKRDNNKRDTIEIDKQDMSQSQAPKDHEQAHGIENTLDAVPTNTGLQN